jgi:TrmH family RNA methyltransferase
VGPSTQPERLASKAEIKQLRELLRDRRARDAAAQFVCEGPRVVTAALDHGVALDACYLGVDASAAAHDVAARAAASGVEVRALPAGVAARVGDTVTPQPLFATAPLLRCGAESLDGADLVLVAARCNDPGNAGTLVRSAAAAGAQGIVLGAGSVDAYNPKVVRASAGACFAVRIVEGRTAVEIAGMLADRGVRCLGAAAAGGAAPETYDLTAPTAFVVGHETHGLDPQLRLHGTVTIPMAAGESLNVAMAGTALLFEAARQRRNPSQQFGGNSARGAGNPPDSWEGSGR